MNIGDRVTLAPHRATGTTWDGTVVETDATGVIVYWRKSHTPMPMIGRHVHADVVKMTAPAGVTMVVGRDRPSTPVTLTMPHHTSQDQVFVTAHRGDGKPVVEPKKMNAHERRRLKRKGLQRNV